MREHRLAQVRIIQSINECAVCFLSQVVGTTADKQEWQERYDTVMQERNAAAFSLIDCWVN